MNKKEDMSYENDKKYSLHILCLEDSFLDAELIKEYLLENFGSETQIDTVSNEEDYITAISKGTYDLILADFTLPGFNGFQALEHTKSITPSVPFICVSGTIGEEVVTELLKQGATDYVFKETLIRLKQSIERGLTESKIQNDLKETHLSLIKSEERYKAFTQTSIDGFFIFDIEGHFLEVNDVYCKISGYSRENLLSMNIKDLESDELDKQIDDQKEKIIDKECSSQFESRHRKSDGTFFYVRNSITFIPNEKIFICFLHDITSRKNKENERLYMIYYDYLTGLYNRRYFEKKLIKIDNEENFPISIIMADINGLKLINDSFGHSAGDEVLIKTAKIIKKCCRTEDTIVRLGGDEFVVLLPGTDTEEAIKISDCIKNSLLKEKVFKIGINISCGIDTKKKSEQSIIEVLQNADNYMYRHKLYEHASTKSNTIDIIMNALFEKSNRESLHSKRVSAICEKIATEMKFEKDEINKIKIAGLLHDIGKIGIAEKILNKSGKLSEEEWKEMKNHPEAGWRILSSSIEYSEIARYIYEHHEKLDGSGYPKGLKDCEISIEAKIINIADSYDAMISVRPYKKALSEVEAINEIKKYSGIQFDQKIAKVFVEKVLGKDW